MESEIENYLEKVKEYELHVKKTAPNTVCRMCVGWMKNVGACYRFKLMHTWVQFYVIIHRDLYQQIVKDTVFGANVHISVL